MRRRIRRNNRVRDLFIFWTMVVVCSIVLAGLAFLAGKYWVGGLMAKGQGTGSAPKIVVKTPAELDGGLEEAKNLTNPPEKAVVKLQERAPNDAERNEIEQSYPQDGASLGRTDADTSIGSDTKPLDDGTGQTDDSGDFVVSAGSFASATNADREVTDLAEKGYRPFIVRVKRNGKSYHRVTVGPYSSRKEAERVRDELSALGKASTVVSR